MVDAPWKGGGLPGDGFSGKVSGALHGPGLFPATEEFRDT
jgi:hypothetical protein